MQQLQQNTNKISELLGSDDPTCYFKSTLSNRIREGVSLDDQESEYLLPHFLMLIVGKPGSGKTTMLQHLLYDKGMYNQKFDQILYVSPSAAKSGIKIDQRFINEIFDINWIFSMLQDVNKEQSQQIYQLMKKQESQRIKSDPTSAQQSLLPPLEVLMNTTTQSKLSMASSVNIDISKLWMKQQTQRLLLVPKPAKTSAQFDMKQFNQTVNKINEMIDQNATLAQKDDMKKNVLIILDDVVAEIKRQEHNTMMCQLFLNRRHLIANGTVSVIIISQKYTKIPSVVRSQANWLIIFKLNPNDFDLIAKDIFVGSKSQWQSLLEFTFGNENESLIKASQQRIGKSFDNLGIFVEKDVYFKNFGQIVFK